MGRSKPPSGNVPTTSSSVTWSSLSSQNPQIALPQKWKHQITAILLSSMLPDKYLQNQKRGNMLSMSLSQSPCLECCPRSHSPQVSEAHWLSCFWKLQSHTAWCLVPSRPLVRDLGKLLTCFQVPHRVKIKQINTHNTEECLVPRKHFPSLVQLPHSYPILSRNTPSFPYPPLLFSPREFISCFPPQRQTSHFLAISQAPRNTA